MLSIIFLILKILGILLLILLLLILFFAVVVLFVPVRYRLTASRYEKLKGELLISWLLRGISLRVFYDGRALARGKVLWFRLFEKQLWPFEEEEGRRGIRRSDRADGNWAAESGGERKGKKNGRKLSGQRVSSRKLERRRNRTGWAKKKAEPPPLPQEEEGKEEEI